MNETLYQAALISETANELDQEFRQPHKIKDIEAILRRYVHRLLAARAEPVGVCLRTAGGTLHSFNPISSTENEGKTAKLMDQELVYLYTFPPAQEAPAHDEGTQEGLEDIASGYKPDATPETEGEKLVAFFCSKEGDELGRAGDHDNLTPAETAIRAMRQRNALRGRLAEVERMAGSEQCAGFDLAMAKIELWRDKWCESLSNAALLELDAAISERKGS